MLAPRQAIAAASLALSLTAGCTPTGMCLLGAAPAITVTVRDAATTAPAAFGAAGIAQSGVFLDTMALIGVPYDSSQADLLATRRAGSGVYSVLCAFR